MKKLGILILGHIAQETAEGIMIYQPQKFPSHADSARDWQLTAVSASYQQETDSLLYYYG